MPFRAFDDSDPFHNCVGKFRVTYNEVLMPFRAFDDSDVKKYRLTLADAVDVLMPFRAFDDSDKAS